MRALEFFKIFAHLVFLPCLSGLGRVPHNISQNVPVEGIVLTLSGTRATETLWELPVFCSNCPQGLMC